MSDTSPDAYQQRCGTCWFARPLYPEGDLLCCRHAPHPGTPDARWTWPKVKERGWCGEYASRSSMAPSIAPAVSVSLAEIFGPLDP